MWRYSRRYSGVSLPKVRGTDSLVGEGVVIVLPAELGLNVPTGGQALACFDDVQVGDFVEDDMTRGIEILLGYQDALYEGQHCGERRGI
jgi:hypothetical protein